MNFFSFSVVVIYLLIASCCTRKNAGSANVSDNDAGYETLIVIDYSDLSGCGFIFLRNDSSKLIPENLHESLKHNNLKIKVKYTVTNKPNICMAGKTIDIIDLKREDKPAQ
ncbi:MAG TPA: hypothetical protein PKN75_05730 [Bacteroidia bacterium]|nr:hypothetical protein [Bacteroidia bacterium]HNU33075.1 hypothetical protein [Bacteroidia bacterium]